MKKLDYIKEDEEFKLSSNDSQFDDDSSDENDST